MPSAECPQPRPDDLLREVGQGVVFRQDADDRFARAVFCDEGRRHVADALADLEARFFQHPDQARGRAVLFQAQLGVVPDVLIDFDQLGLEGVQVADHVLLNGT